MTDTTIREPREEELDRLVDIWLKCSLISHHFINAHYWQEQKEAMRGLYLPLSENYVAEVEEGIVGFVSMMGDYMAALFIEPEYQRRKIGRSLLQYVKQNREAIHLKVYAKNGDAVNFYKQNGFHISGTGRDEATGEEELFMEWRKKD